VIGGLVGVLNLAVRRRVTDPTVNTVISFAVPFVAAVPTGLLGASGLVAAVVAGLATGVRAPRHLSPQNRLSDAQNWRTVELVLEGAVFLTMGVQIKAIVTSVENDHAGVGTAVLVAVGALALTVLVRAAYVAPLLGVLSARSRRIGPFQARVQDMQGRMGTPEGRQETFREANPRSRREASERTLDRFAFRVTQAVADLEYFQRAPLGWREGTAVVWAGMRGAVTVAAAQTLPEDAPQRSVLVLVAFAVATLSLLLQGGTIGPLLRRIAPPVDAAAAAEQADAEQARIADLLRTSTEAVPAPPAPLGPTQEAFTVAKTHRLAMLTAQRSALLDARDHGTFDAELLEKALANLDAAQIALEMRGSIAV